MDFLLALAWKIGSLCCVIYYYFFLFREVENDTDGGFLVSVECVWVGKVEEKLLIE